MASKVAGISLFLAVSLTPRAVMKDWAEMFVVWNVGQGQWLTYIDSSICDHFDMGGDLKPPSPVIHFCQHVPNRVWLSHGDWDHINYIGKSGLPDLCLASGQPHVKSRSKRRLLTRLRRCHTANPRWLATVWEPRPQLKSTNESSLVLKAGSTLIPGDSTSAQEKYWAKSPQLQGIRRLILGHHGSRTSTSRFLLRNLPALHQAIGSSRRSRYGHPHYEVEARLREFKIPLLTTEDWGSIRIR